MTKQAPAEPDVMALLSRTRVIPVVVLQDAAAAEPLAVALLDGGLPCAEITFRSSAAVETIARMARIPDFAVGAGTVLSPEQVDQAVSSGAQFIVSPGLKAAVVDRCLELGVPVFPGVATASELMAATDLGLSTVKLFPAESCGGVATVKALSAPFPKVRFIPTGGIDATNATDYLSCPQVLAVGGSWMVAPTLLAQRDFATVTERARAALSLVRALPAALER